MSSVSFEWVNNPADLEIVKGFAKDMGHELTGKYPVMVARAGEKFVGYVEAINVPVLLTAWVKDAPKECVEAIKKLKHWQEVPNGTCLALCSAESPLHELMPRLGFEDTGLKLFKS